MILNLDNKSTEELLVLINEFDDMVQVEKERLKNERCSERTDVSDVYFLPKECKGVYREICNLYATKSQIDEGDPKERIFLKRKLRKLKIDFNQDDSLKTLKNLLN